MDLLSQEWFLKLKSPEKDLISEAFFLLGQAKESSRVLPDYSYVVFPAVKAYEGFIKRFLYQIGLISEEKYRGDFFRLGKALNPELEPRMRDECLFDELGNYFDDREFALRLWHTWKECRNKLVHYFPHRLDMITLKESEEKLKMVVTTIKEVVEKGYKNKISNF